ncbi:MAG: hypothetical protein K2J16_05320 [Clostridia bacterium]|nr:hypothetical protein [Clostridia bacterium]
MENKQTFDKFKSKLTFEAILCSVMSSLSIGFAVGGLISLICWLCGYKDGIWVALGVGAGCAVIAFPLFYILKFRPTVEKTGQRVDRTGLQERAVTMLDYADDQSYMATRQRLDAVSHILAVSPKAIKATIPVWAIIAFSCTFSFGVPFGVVGALYQNDAISSPTEEFVDPMENFFAVSYVVEDGGEIIGNADQLCEPGSDAETVTAIAMDGYMFMGWDDGYMNPTRTDMNINEDLEFTALFKYIDGGQDGEEGDFDGPGSGDSATDNPSESDESGGQGGEDGDGDGSKGGEDGKGEGKEEGEGKGDGKGEGAGGKFTEGNQVIDGQTYYRDRLDEYKDEAMDELSSNEDLPDDVREFIESYYEGV